MMPPKCVVCGQRFSIESGKSGGLYFKRTQEEESYMKRMKEERKIGHPKGYGWFCVDHYIKAKALKSGFLHEAIDELKEKKD